MEAFVFCAACAAREFGDPAALRPRIEMNELLAIGPHFCIGSALARRLVLQTALRRMLERLPNIEVVDPDFRQRYVGQIGELRPSIPMRVR